MRIVRFCTLLSILLCAFAMVRNAQATPSLAVIYPDAEAPAAGVFREIIAGIDEQYQQPFIKHAIPNHESPEDSIAWIEQHQPDMLIALGKRGYRIAKRLYRDRPVAIGGLPIRPNGISGISLLTDPRVLFEALHTLAPTIRKVNVVHSPGHRWLIDIARTHANEMSLQLNAIEVSNIKDAVNAYEVLLKKIDAKTEALWLPNDNITAHEQVILPKLLETSWEQKLVLFSSTVTHAKRGALFSVFPDNLALGAQLVTMIAEMYGSQQPSGVIPLAHVKLAVNLRTAAHLGYDYPAQQQRQFNLIFPQSLL